MIHVPFKKKLKYIKLEKNNELTELNEQDGFKILFTITHIANHAVMSA